MLKRLCAAMLLFAASAAMAPAPPQTQPADAQYEADIAKRAENNKAILAKARERLVVPADAAAAGRLAGRYTSPELGELAVQRKGTSVVFDFGEWHSVVATRKNDDGTLSFMTIDPNLEGFEFVETKRGGQRALIVREGQHEYTFTEAL